MGPERLKVHHYGKSSRELTGLYMRQEVLAHEGSIWSIKFSPDGRFLASGGEDGVVRVWEVQHVDASASAVAQELSASLPPHPPPPAASTDGGRSVASPGLAAQLSRKVRRGRSGKDVLPENVVVPESAFALAEQPSCSMEGHQDDVLDLSWSKSQLLSSSMDHTVRLWDVATKTCLRVFPHSDYGFKNTSSQISASYTADGRYVVCASEDSNVYVWRRVPGSVGGVAGGGAGGIGVRAKTWLTSRSYEYFFCRDVSVAVPWPGSPSSFPGGDGRGDAPRKQQQSSSRRDDDDVVGAAGCVPRGSKSGPMTYRGGLPRPELSRREPQSSARWHGGAEGGNAWGMVLVTASRGGEIRVYQNFGLPLANLFH